MKKFRKFLFQEMSIKSPYYEMFIKWYVHEMYIAGNDLKYKMSNKNVGL